MDRLPTAIPLPAGNTLVAGRGKIASGRVSPPHHHPEGQLLGTASGLFTPSVFRERFFD